MAVTDKFYFLELLEHVSHTWKLKIQMKPKTKPKKLK